MDNIKIKRMINDFYSKFCPYDYDDVRVLIETIYELENNYNVDIDIVKFIDDLYNIAEDSNISIDEVDPVYFLYDKILIKAEVGNQSLENYIGVDGDYMYTHYYIFDDKDVLIQNIIKELLNGNKMNGEARFVLDNIGLLDEIENNYNKLKK